MKQSPIFRYSTIAAVTLLHMGVIAWAWKNVTPPPPPPDAGILTVVDVAALDTAKLGDESVTEEGAPAPLEDNPQPPKPEPPKPTTPPPVPKTPPVKPPAAKPLPAVKAVETAKPADLPKPVETTPKAAPQPKPQPQPESKPAPAPEPPKTQSAPAAPNQNASGGASPNAVNREKGGQGGGGKDRNSTAPSNNAVGRKDGHPDGNDPAGGSRNAIVEGGQYANIPKPVYPPKALEDDVEGTVILDVVVGVNGSVEDVKVQRSSGSSILNNAAIRHVRNITFRPKRIDGQPMRTRFTVPVKYELGNN